MSSVSITASVSEDNFQCSICLQVYSDPVTTPCGHNFCKTCLSGHWDNSELCHCPTCNKRFHARPEVSTNTVIEEISVQIKRRKVETRENIDVPRCVKCDVCTGEKIEAQKLCLVCLTSYCEAHLEPHRRVPSLMRHKLIDPVENLEARICKKHEKILELFCRHERVCICQLCSETDHKGHETVPVEEEGALWKTKVRSRKAKIKTMIEERLAKTKEFRVSSVMSREKAHIEMDSSDKLFNTLMSQIQVMQTKLKSNIEEKLRKSQKRDKAMICELHQEIAELQRKQEELDELSQNADPLQFLQALSNTLMTKDWTNIRIYPDLCVQSITRAMSHLMVAFQAELKTLTNTELTRMRRYKESVTFDPATAGSCLVVSELGKRLKFSKTAMTTHSADSARFDSPIVLGTKGFTSGRHYWEVRVGLRNDWFVGVAKGTVPRTGMVAVTSRNGFFAIGKKGFDYQVNCPLCTILHLCPRPRNVGIYVDYAEGRVSFYDVDEKLHIYSFKLESFAEKMFPCFYLYSRATKSQALVITSV